MNNYIEFEIGGKLRGFKLGLGFLGDTLNHLDLDIAGFGKMLVNNPFLATPVVIFYGHKSDCDRKSIPVTFSLSDVEDWIENIENGVSNDNIVRVMQIVVQSATKHLPTKKEDEEEVKKN